MMHKLALLLVLAVPAHAETVVAVRTISANSVIELSDVTISTKTILGGESDPMLFVGMEAKIAIYAGRAIQPGDVRFPAIVERNQRLPLIYRGGGITIRTEGRSLGRAGPGDSIRVMNLSSRATVVAIIGDDGIAYVGGISG